MHRADLADILGMGLHPRKYLDPLANRLTETGWFVWFAKQGAYLRKSRNGKEDGIWELNRQVRKVRQIFQNQTLS